jgi:methionine-rich copper-binding protein CopC
MTRQNIQCLINILLSLLLIISLKFPIPVFAHAILVKSHPEADSTIEESPKQVDVWFNEKVASELKALTEINSAGKRVDNKDIKQAKLDRSHIFIRTPQLPPDTYTVRYRVMSSDTHIVTGRFNFTIKNPE